MGDCERSGGQYLSFSSLSFIPHPLELQKLKLWKWQDNLIQVWKTSNGIVGKDVDDVPIEELEP